MALMWSSKQNFISFSLIYGTHFKNVVDEKLFAVFFYSVLAFNGFCSTIYFFAHLMLHCWAKCKVLKWVCKHITGFYIHLFSKSLLSRIERPFWPHITGFNPSLRFHFHEKVSRKDFCKFCFHFSCFKD